MFRLLSNESNIFSVPLYIGALLLIVLGFNLLDIKDLNYISAIITFCGIAMGYFCFNAISLNYQTHLPHFIYTAFVFALYPGNLDLGIALSLFTNSLLILLLTDDDLSIRKNSYVLIGSILAINFIFLPTTWPMAIFVFFHIIGTSDRIGLHFFRVLFGILMIALSYFGIAYFFGMNSWNAAYFPFDHFKPSPFLKNLAWLSPIVLMLIYSVMDHFRHYNLKSPSSKFKYTLILVFTLTQLITVVLYMGEHYEYLLLLALPVSIILSRMLKFLPKYWMRELGFWTILFCLFFFKLANYFKINI